MNLSDYYCLLIAGVIIEKTGVTTMLDTAEAKREIKGLGQRMDEMRNYL